PDGKAAPYAANNIPLKPKWFLPISLKPLKEGDFTMTWGYPGNTNRYESSFGIELATDINNPSLVKLRDVRLKNMFEEMKKDPATKLKLAGSYAIVANYWKFFDGETKQLLKYDIAGKKRKEEAQFKEWAKNKTEYKYLITDWERIYKEWKPNGKHLIYLNEGILRSQLISFAASLSSLEKALVSTNSKAADIKAAKEAAAKQRERFLSSFNRESDQRNLAALTQLFYEDVPKDQH